ncbi:MAG: peptidoglycan-binding protein [Evtepia gabavorous]
MPIIVTPYIPTYITVHLGTPDSDAENLTISFREYIKNVASSEVYPTWHNSALRANILAQVSFALNRVYTEFYPSQGYSFNITASTAYDQKFIKGRNIFDSVSTLVDELFTVYIRRQGFVEPLAASFCNGTTTVCDGLSQWGSENMAQQGYDSVQILRHYYGDNIELVTNAPMQDIQYSYPGAPLRLGDISPEVQVAQIMINRISVAYPAIPKIWQVDGIFSSSTEDAVRELQHIFNLTVDGIIGKSTWYMMVHLYTGILRLSELVSEGRPSFSWISNTTKPLSMDKGESVTLLQYLLSILAQFYITIPFLTIDGVFGDETQAAVQALQLDAGLPQTGTVDEETWDVIIDRFIGIDRTVLSNPKFFPYQSPSSGEVEPELRHSYFSARPGQFPGFPLELGASDNDQERSESWHLTSPCFSLGPVSTLQEMLRTIAFVNRSSPFSVPGRFDEETLEVMMFQR